MKGYGREKGYPCGLIIVLLLVASVIWMEKTVCARRINCDPSVYDPATKTCTGFYCHSNGRGEYRPIRWEKNRPRLNCSSCHNAPPMGSRHSKATLETCGQKCHTQTINNAHTTGYHINGMIEGVFEGGAEGECLACHSEPQGPHPPISPSFQMFSNHIGGPPTDYDCVVCHMEDTEGHHRNGQVELKNHQGGAFFTRASYNQFCLSCHDLGSSLFGPAPFSTARPIPSIRNELASRQIQAVETVRFWYPHNHMTGQGYDAAQIMNQSGPNSFFFVDTTMHMRAAAVNESSTKARYKTTVLGIPMGGGGGMPASIPSVVAAPVSPLMAANPIIGGGTPMMLGPTAALGVVPPVAVSAPPIMGGTIVAPVTPMMGGGPVVAPALAPIAVAPTPMMGGGVTAMTLAPVVAAPTPMMGGGVAITPALAPVAVAPTPMMGGGITAMTLAPVVAAPTPMMGGGTILPGGGMLSMGPGAGATVLIMPGNVGMDMVRTGIGTMVMGPGVSPLMGLELMLGMPGTMIGMQNPLMTISNPLMGMLNMGGIPGMPGMVTMPGMLGIGGMPGMVTMPGMLNMGGMPGMPAMGNMPGMPAMGNMPGMLNMGGMPGMPGMGGMGGMPGMPGMGGMGGMPGMPGMGGMGGMPGMPGMGGMGGMPGMPGMGGMGGMPGMPGMGGIGGMPGMGNIPGMPGTGNMMGPVYPGNMMGPTKTSKPTNTQNNQNQQNQQNSAPRETAACIACHTFENADLLNLSVIANNFCGHFSHQDCIACHAPHGSQFSGLLKEGINWNINNRSCTVDYCHPTYMHDPPLAGTGVIYEMRMDSPCNTYSCHIGSTQPGIYRMRITGSSDVTMTMDDDEKR